MSEVLTTVMNPDLSRLEIDGFSIRKLGWWPPRLPDSKDDGGHPELPGLYLSTYDADGVWEDNVYRFEDLAGSRMNIAAGEFYHVKYPEVIEVSRYDDIYYYDKDYYGPFDFKWMPPDENNCLRMAISIETYEVYHDPQPDAPHNHTSKVTGLHHVEYQFKDITLETLKGGSDESRS